MSESFAALDSQFRSLKRHSKIKAKTKVKFVTFVKDLSNMTTLRLSWPVALAKAIPSGN